MPLHEIMDRPDPLSEILGFPEFVSEACLDEIIDLIQEECARPDVLLDYGPSDRMFGGELLDPVFGNVLGCDQDSALDPFIAFGEDVKENGDEDNDGEVSSATTPTPTKKLKRDRSRTLVSERQRRCRMKEKLYALRSLVPNITKMDKASIIGDAVLYVQELQFQLRSLEDDIEHLEFTVGGTKRSRGSKIQGKPKRVRVPGNDRNPLSSKLLQIDVLEVCERTFNARVVCEMGDRVVVSLYRALESITGFELQTSNLALVSNRYVFTFNLNVKEGKPDVDSSSLRARISGALLRQGFEFRLTPAYS